MAHPQVFDDTDPYLARVRQLAAVLHGSTEQVSHGRPAFSLGPSGWVGVDLGPATDWTEVAELLDSAYRLTAPKRLVAELDASSGPSDG